jgi:hypothetical protein
VPASAEIVLEGVIHPGEMALEGPYGDHTGYYNEQAEIPGVHHRAHHHAPGTRSTTAPTPASRRTSRRFSASR